MGCCQLGDGSAVELPPSSSSVDHDVGAREGSRWKEDRCIYLTVVGMGRLDAVSPRDTCIVQRI